MTQPLAEKPTQSGPSWARVLIGFFISLFIWAGVVMPPLFSENSAPGEVIPHVTAAEAYQMWLADPDRVKIIDCRTEIEYALLGHPTMAHNIPSKIWVEAWNMAHGLSSLPDNPDFLAEVARRFGKEDTLLVLCRMGNRSGEAVKRLMKAGFLNVKNIIDGFEGFPQEADGTPGKHLPTPSGWKNSGAPWTRDLNPDLIDRSRK